MPIVEEEEKQCRICRSGAEDDQPLFHPCKCSGSIQYTHQDCLVEWLKHSKKKHCELCSHPFVFRRKYKSNMPKGNLPFHHYLGLMISMTIKYTLLFLRAILVCFCWLGILPTVNIYVWRTYFRFVDMLCLLIYNFDESSSGDPPKRASISTSTVGSNLSNVTASAVRMVIEGKNSSSSAPTAAATSGFARFDRIRGLGWDTGRAAKILSSLMKDCFEGQILTCSIVVLFVSIFLLREWILQNIPATPQDQPLPDPVAPPAPQAPPAVPPPRVIRPIRAPGAPQPAAMTVQEFQDAAIRDLQDAATNGILPDGPPFAALQTTGLSNRMRAVPGESVEGASSNPFDPPEDDVKKLRELRLARFGSLGKVGEGSGSTIGGAEVEKEQEQEQEPKQSDPSGKGKARAMDGVGYFGDELPDYADLADVEDVDSFLQPEKPSSLAATSIPTATQPDFNFGPSQPNVFSTSISPSEGGRRSPSRPFRKPTSGFIRKSSHQKKQAQPRAVSEPLLSNRDSQEESQIAPEGFNFNFTVPPVLSSADPQSSRSERASSVPIEEGESSSTPFRFDNKQPSPPNVSAPFTSPTQKLSNQDFWQQLESISQPVNKRHGADGDQEAQFFEKEVPEVPEPDLKTLPEASTSSSALTTEEKGKGRALDDPVPSTTEAGSSSQPFSESIPDRTGLESTSSECVASAVSSNIEEGEEEEQEEHENSDDAWIDEEEDESDSDEDELGEFEAEVVIDAEHELWAEAEAAVAEADADGEGIREELEGVFEAIGMRGNILGLFSNVALICTLCSLFLLVFIAFPYFVGKLMGPVEVFYGLSVPIQLLRFFTDPLFEGLYRSAKWLLTPIFKMVAKSSLASKASALVPSVGESASSTSFSAFSLSGLAGHAKSIGEAASAHLPVRIHDAVVKTFSKFDYETALDQVSELPEKLISEVKALDSKRFGMSWSDRAFSVVLGHLFLILYITLHTKLVKWAGYTHMNWTRNWMKQQYLVAKVLFFIVVELVLFPLCCGYLLNLCVFPLFSNEAPILSHWITLSGVFALWLCGTLYMFLFAQFVGTTRKSLRAGALCFIRDPADPNYHPVKEILERSSLLQLRKIATSAVMYGMICFAVIGVNVHGVRLLFKTILPLRWKPYEALSDVPYDLIVLHMVLPWLVSTSRPDRAFRSLSRKWWISAARLFRLSSYLIGGNPSEEQGHWIAQSWKDSFKISFRRFSSKIRSQADEALVEKEIVSEIAAGRFVSDGALARVPADDHNTLFGPIVIYVDSLGIPIDEENAAALQKQEEAIAKAGRSTPPSYTTIYVPPNLRHRIIALIGFLWVCLSIGIISAIVVPLAVGRLCVSLVGLPELHDSYPFTVGALLLWLLNKVRRTVIRTVKRSRRGLVISKTKEALVHMIKLFYLVVSFAIITPVLLGLTMNQYVIVPFRLNNYRVPVASLGQIWALGVIGQQLICFSASGFVEQRMTPIWANGFRRPDIPQATRQVILPFVSALLLLLLTPPFFVWAGMLIVKPVGRSAEYDQIWLRGAYSFITSTAVACRLTLEVNRRMEGWTQSLRDELFLESTELRNYSKPEASKSTSDQSKGTEPSELERDDLVPDVLLRQG